MFKTNQEIIVIQAESIKPIDSGVVFWSHDKGTAKLIFQLKKDEINQTLAEGTIVPILLEFNSSTAENCLGKHIYHAVIEDALNGIVSIVLEDNILGYQGRVGGSIYIELPDSRSLDTAGRFTFDIKRSPIDENVPELEDYYWQGFNEIMAQYHQTIVTIKLEAKTMLDSLTADVTTAKTKVTQLEQSITTANTNLNARIDEINKKIDDNDVFTKAESSANVIDQVIGKESNMEAMSLDFKDKVSGSLVENVNKIASNQYNSLLSPSNVSWLEFSQANIDKVKALDKELFLRNERVNGYMQQVLICYDVLAYLINRLGENFFTDRGAKEVSSQVTVIRSMISDLAGNVWGYGSGPNGNKMTFQVWTHVRSRWEGPLTTTNSTVTRIKWGVSSTNDYIDSTGKMYFLVNAEPSDGVTTSTLNIDYVSLQFDLNVSANDYIKSMIAANHVENLATPEEAKAGTDTTKTMTPATTAQSIDNRAVTLASNQTIGGTKNFENTPLINDIPAGIANEACWCEDFAVNNLAVGIVNPDLERFSTTSDAAFSMSGKVITIKKKGVYLLAVGVNYSGLTSWLTFGISRLDGTSLVNRNLLGSSTSGSNSLTYVRSFAGNDQIRIEFSSGAAGTTMQKINLAIVKIA